MLRQFTPTLVVCLIGTAAFAQAPATRPPQTPEGVRDQIARLSAPDPIARAFAACFLAEMRRDASPALPALKRLLADATPIDPIVCRRDIEGPTTVVALWKSAPGLEAARALAAIGDEGVEALLSAAADRDTSTRRHAVRGLTYVRDTRSEPVFLTTIRDADAATREQAARGLGQFRDETVVNALLIALKDPAPEVREQAARSLGRVGRRR